MGSEWAEKRLQAVAFVVGRGLQGKTYMSGLDQLMQLAQNPIGPAGNKAIANIFNNSVPLAGMRNEFGKWMNPHMKELNSSMWDSIRNRNLASEALAPLTGQEALPNKHDLLNGKPIKEWDPLTRMWNAVSPISFNLDYTEGRNFLFRSGYDLRMSTYYSPGPNSINLTDSPMIRSKYQKAIGDLNLEKELTKLSRQKKIIESILEMEKDIRDGNRGKYEAKDYYHNKMIGQLFTRARKQAWLNIQGEELVQNLSSEQLGKKLKRKQKTAQTSFDEVLTIYK